jgi:phosphoglycolate phosphatase
MRFRAIIFDLDGTLLDTLADIADAMNAALGKMGFPAHETAAYRYLTGDGARAMAERSLPEAARDALTIESCIWEFRSEYDRRWGAKTRPYPGIPELLSELSGRDLEFSVLSNKLEEFTRRAVRDFLQGFTFSPVIGAKPGLPPKPDPAGALLISRALRVASAEIIYLGDSGVDMLTAVRAGMFPVGALWGFRDGRELRQNGAAVLVSSPAELLGLVG